MVNIYDKANEFERALRESDEYKAHLKDYILIKKLTNFIHNSYQNKKI